jgi:predicted PurR-regulated permease PerM
MSERDRELRRERLEDLKAVHDRMPRWLFLLLAGALFAVFAHQASSLLVILAVSALFAYLLNGPVKRTDALGIRRTVAVSAFFACGLLVLAGTEALLEPYLRSEIVNFSEQLPELSRNLDEVVRRQLAGPGPAASSLERAAKRFLGEIVRPGEFINRALSFPRVFDQAAPFLLGVVLTPFFVFFLLRDWPSFSKQILRLIPPPYVEKTISMLCETDILVGSYLRGLSLDCLAVAAIAAIGLSALGIEYPITLGILTGVANVVPYFGPLTAFLTSAMIALLQFGELGPVFRVLAFYAALRIFDDLVIQPLTVGKSVKLHPMLLVITIIGGERLFGVGGMVIAVPVVTISQKLLSILMEYRQMEKLARRRRPTAEPGILL